MSPTRREAGIAHESRTPFAYRIVLPPQHIKLKPGPARARQECTLPGPSPALGLGQAWAAPGQCSALCIHPKFVFLATP